MTDNLKTWPEKLYFPQSHQEYLEEINCNFSQRKSVDDIEYIRSQTSTWIPLRDYFAANALQGLIASHGLSFDTNYVSKFAKAAYQYADALLFEKGDK